MGLLLVLLLVLLPSSLALSQDQTVALSTFLPPAFTGPQFLAAGPKTLFCTDTSDTVFQFDLAGVPSVLSADPLLDSPQGIVYNAARHVLIVANGNGNNLLSVDAASGATAVFAQSPLFGTPQGIWLTGGVYYVTNSASNTISKVLADGTVLAVSSSPLLNSPQGIVALNGMLVVANAGSNTIIAVNPGDGSATVLSNDTTLLNSPQGMMLYDNGVVIVNGDNDLLQLVWPAVGAPATLKAIAASPLYNNAQGIALSPDGSTFLVGNLGGVNVLAVDAKTLTVSQLLTPTSPLSAPTGLSYSPPYLYSLNTNTLLRTHVATGASHIVARSALLSAPQGLTFQNLTDGTRLWYTVNAAGDGSVIRINEATGTVDKILTDARLAQGGPTGVYFSAAAQSLFVALSQSNELLVSRRNAPFQTIGNTGAMIGPARMLPSSVAPGSLLLSNTGNNNILQIDMSTGATTEFFGTKPLLSPQAMALSADGSLVVASTSQNTLYVIAGSTALSVPSLFGMVAPFDVVAASTSGQFYASSPTTNQIYVINFLAPASSGNSAAVGLGVGLGLGLGLGLPLAAFVLVWTGRKHPESTPLMHRSSVNAAAE